MKFNYLLTPILSLALCFNAFSQGQNPILVGDATNIGGGVFRISSAAGNVAGAIWFQNRLNLNQDFDISYGIYVGNNDGGADGICFVLQKEGYSALALTGGHLGYYDLISPSIGVEVDTWDNGSSWEDIPEDHIAIAQNGIHTSMLAGPVIASATSANIEDGQDHRLRVVWTANDTTLNVYFDGVQRLTFGMDMIGRVFGGVGDSVIWGFTGATGIGANEQRIFNVQLTESKPLLAAAGPAFSLQPNPAGHTFRVTLPENAGYTTLSVRDALGKMVASYPIEKGQREVIVPTKGLKPGQYAAQLYSDDVASKPVKLVVR